MSAVLTHRGPDHRCSVVGFSVPDPIVIIENERVARLPPQLDRRIRTRPSQDEAGSRQLENPSFSLVGCVGAFPKRGAAEPMPWALG